MFQADSVRVRDSNNANKKYILSSILLQLATLLITLGTDKKKQENKRRHKHKTKKKGIWHAEYLEEEEKKNHGSGEVRQWILITRWQQYRPQDTISSTLERDRRVDKRKCEEKKNN